MLSLVLTKLLTFKIKTKNNEQEYHLNQSGNRA